MIILIRWCANGPGAIVQWRSFGTRIVLGYSSWVRELCWDYRLVAICGCEDCPGIIVWWQFVGARVALGLVAIRGCEDCPGTIVW